MNMDPFMCLSHALLLSYGMINFLFQHTNATRHILCEQIGIDLSEVIENFQRSRRVPEWPG